MIIVCNYCMLLSCSYHVYLLCVIKGFDHCMWVLCLNIMLVFCVIITYDNIITTPHNKHTQ